MVGCTSGNIFVAARSTPSGTAVGSTICSAPAVVDGNYTSIQTSGVVTGNTYVEQSGDWSVLAYATPAPTPISRGERSATVSTLRPGGRPPRPMPAYQCIFIHTSHKTTSGFCGFCGPWLGGETGGRAEVRTRVVFGEPRGVFSVVLTAAVRSHSYPGDSEAGRFGAQHCAEDRTGSSARVGVRARRRR